MEWGISNPITAIEQITYLLFIKRLEELDKNKVDSIFLGSYEKIIIETVENQNKVFPYNFEDIEKIKKFPKTEMVIS